MNHRDLDIYRELYKETLADIWDKVSDLLEERGLAHADAEYAGLLITEWIRTTWGGQFLVERHLGDPRPATVLPEEAGPALLDAPPAAVDPLVGSRFATLRDHAVAVLAQLAPGIAGHDGIALTIVETIRRDYRGHYITRIKRLSQLQRDQYIWRQATSAARVEQLAVEHGISVVRAYQINKEMQRRKDLRDQLVLSFD
ncbi:hypothetical protein GURASL_13440 [Geotalea uraniireducens]|uniref:Mor transcription activator domain-containing protein n=1 Tax=Geotalea uraniireducens TaxID=351604 RepID=A0ABM8EIU7_9BACT|nr:hypothetical protein [Geotalea uraniireducens]BDV42421.1 hypothetical protein GURASL_13440 [Geotalea uraniireducens]